MNHELLAWFKADGRNRRVSFSKAEGGQFIAFLQRHGEAGCHDGIGGTPEDALTDALTALREAEFELAEAEVSHDP